MQPDDRVASVVLLEIAHQRRNGFAVGGQRATPVPDGAAASVMRLVGERVIPHRQPGRHPRRPDLFVPGGDGIVVAVQPATLVFAHVGVGRGVLGVGGKAVGAFAEVFHHEFPVGVGGERLAVRDPGAFDPVRRDVRADVLRDDVEVRRVVPGKAEVDEPLEHPHPAGMEAVRLGVESARHTARPDATPVEPVAPGMVWTDEPRGVALGLGTDPRSAVPAYVEERPHLAFPAAQHDDRLARDLVEEVVAGVRDPGDVVGEQPFARNDALEVAGEDVGVSIERLIEGEAGALARDQGFDVEAAGGRCHDGRDLLGIDG